MYYLYMIVVFLLIWAFPKGAGYPQYAVLAPIPNAKPLQKYNIWVSERLSSLCFLFPCMQLYNSVAFLLQFIMVHQHTLVNPIRQNSFQGY